VEVQVSAAVALRSCGNRVNRVIRIIRIITLTCTLHTASARYALRLSSSLEHKPPFLNVYTAYTQITTTDA